MKIVESLHEGCANGPAHRLGAKRQIGRSTKALAKHMAINIRQARTTRCAAAINPQIKPVTHSAASTRHLAHNLHSQHILPIGKERRRRNTQNQRNRPRHPAHERPDCITHDGLGHIVWQVVIAHHDLRLINRFVAEQDSNIVIDRASTSR